MDQNEPAQGLARLGGMLPKDAAAQVARVVGEHLAQTAPRRLPSAPAEMARITGDIDTWTDEQWAALSRWRLEVASVEADNAARLEALTHAVRALRESGGDEELARAIAMFAARAYPRFVELVQERHDGVMPHDLETLRRLCRRATTRLEHLPREWRVAKRMGRPVEAPKRRSWG